MLEKRKAFYGIGERNRNGQLLVDCCRRHNLMAANTWFQAKVNALHAWLSPDRWTKNQIDYILVDKRFRNGIRNCKAKPGADCGSDHNSVVAVIKIKLKKVIRHVREKRWDLEKLKDVTVRKQFQQEVQQDLEVLGDDKDSEELWRKIKHCLQNAAEKVCGKDV